MIWWNYVGDYNNFCWNYTSGEFNWGRLTYNIYYEGNISQLLVSHSELRDLGLVVGTGRPRVQISYLD
jgi:hypothetical protein